MHHLKSAKAFNIKLTYVFSGAQTFEHRIEFHSRIRIFNILVLLFNFLYISFWFCFPVLISIGSTIPLPYAQARPCYNWLAHQVQNLLGCNIPRLRAACAETASTRKAQIPDATELVSFGQHLLKIWYSEEKGGSTWEVKLSLESD